MTALPIGPVMIDIAGHELTPLDQEKIAHPNTGALILFARNYDNPNQLQALVKAIRNARKGPLLIAVDQEGGRVQRFRQGFTRLPPVAAYAQRPELAQSAGWLMAAEVLAVDVDFSFAPVLDIDCGISEIIGNRSFSNDSEQASELASQFIKGMRGAGMSATGKHFPGHGAVALDSHLTLPIDPRPLNDIRARDLIPFQRLINEGLEAIMPAHVVYPDVDSMPAGFSPFWLQQILRGELQFDGAIFSDDLSMEGAAGVGDFMDRARLAQEAGCDMLLVCNNASAAERVLDQLPIKNSSDRERRLQAMRGRPSLSRSDLLKSETWQAIAADIQQLTENYAQ